MTRSTLVMTLARIGSMAPAGCIVKRPEGSGSWRFGIAQLTEVMKKLYSIELDGRPMGCVRADNEMMAVAVGAMLRPDLSGNWTARLVEAAPASTPAPTPARLATARRGWQPERDFSFAAEVFCLSAEIQEAGDVERLAADIAQREADRAAAQTRQGGFDL